jgi:hypothetical protein
MPRIIVTTDQTERGDAAVLLDEQVQMVHLSTDHSAMQFIERLGWAISDAEDAERVQVPRQARRRTHARPPARKRARARNPVHA